MEERVIVRGLKKSRLTIEMFTKRGVKAISQVRRMATEAGDAPASGNKMENLLEKLASITNNGPSDAGQNTMIAKQKGKQNRNNRGNNGSNNQRSGKGYRKEASGRSNTRSNNSNRNNSERKNQRRGTGTGGRRSNSAQTVSHFDRFKNPKKASNAATKADGSLNAEGLSFADLQEARALFIRRKLSEDKPIALHTSEEVVFDFFHSRAVHKAQIYDPKTAKFAKFEEAPNVYQPAEVSKPELELLKDKMGYDTNSRILRALEQITTKRGFKLADVEKRNVSFLPYNGLLYPYANTTLPNNLDRPKANLQNLSNIPEEEITATIASVVRGQRPELVFNPKEKFKTEQLKINAQVVANGLNRNAQLQVDNLHKSMAKVMLGQQPVKTLPQPVFAPKKL